MRRAVALAVPLLATSLLACISEERSARSTADRRGGIVTVALDSSPDTLNTALSNLAATAVVLDEVLAGPYRVAADLSYVPELLAKEAEVTEDPFTMTFHIREDAVWSDGTPVTARDMRFSWATMTDPRWDIIFRDPPAQIERAEIIDDKTIRFVFGEPYAPWKDLFVREGVLPVHVLRGENFEKAWRDDLDISSGPFMVDEWAEGDHLSLVRNPDFWGEAPLLDGVTYRFIENTNTLIQSLRGGEVDVAVGQPEKVPAMQAIDGLNVSVKAGTRFEYLEFDVEAVPHFVRKAIAIGIDRDAIVENIVHPAQPDAEALDSLLYLTGQPGYEPHFDIYIHNPQGAVDLLEENGCRRNGDEPYVCDGEELSYTFATIAGRERSELQLEIIQEQLRRIGIEVRAQLGDTNAVVDSLLTGRAQIAGLSVDLTHVPFYRDFILGCDFSLGHYCDELVDRLLARGIHELDASEQERIYNRVDEIVAESVAFLPLYQVPNVLVWNDRVEGIEHGIAGDPFINVEEWYLAD